ncbi:MAG: hypothetical protein FWD35_05440 [Oscillospiraceae bacterium]|nr:hypothetical protein [Oscillospiraceae bacterium]
MNFKKNTQRAKRLRENGCRTIVTRNEGGKEVIIENYFITPEEIAASNERRNANLASRRV